jgi:hypothetical protein
MTNLEIYNVLFKSVENKLSPFCKAFKTENEARAWIDTKIVNLDLVAKSTMGWNDDKTIDDYRAEDKHGSSYYFVIYRQII